MLDANQVIDIFENPQTGHLTTAGVRQQAEGVSEIKNIHNPLDLLLIMLSPKAGRQIRFEARRKLILAELALKLNIQAEKHEEVLDDFTNFLNTNLWTDVGLGVAQQLEFVSEHSPLNYSCTNITLLNPHETVTPSRHKAYHSLPVRKFKNSKGKDVAVYDESRLKTTPLRILKLLRKNTKNEGVLDDNIGFKFTFRTKKDIDHFLTSIQDIAQENGSVIVVIKTASALKSLK